MATARCIWSDWDLSDLWVKGKSTSHVDFKAQNPKAGSDSKKRELVKARGQNSPRKSTKDLANKASNAIVSTAGLWTGCQSVRLFLRSEDVPGCLHNFGWMHQLRRPLAIVLRSPVPTPQGPTLPPTGSSPGVQRHRSSGLNPGRNHGKNGHQ